MSWTFLAFAESPSRGRIRLLEAEVLTSLVDQRKGLEMGHSFRADLISALGGDGDVGGDEISLWLGICRSRIS